MQTKMPLSRRVTSGLLAGLMSCILPINQQAQVAGGGIVLAGDTTLAGATTLAGSTTVAGATTVAAGIRLK